MTRRLLESGRHGPPGFTPCRIRAPPRSRRWRASASSPNSPGSRSCCSTSRPARASRLCEAARARGVPVVRRDLPALPVHDRRPAEPTRTGGAGLMCSPPQRRTDDQEALWDGLAPATLQVVSSDHAPYRLDASGKFAHGTDAPFNRIANGMPGLELRLPLMFDAMVSERTAGRAEVRRADGDGAGRHFRPDRQGPDRHRRRRRHRDLGSRAEGHLRRERSARRDRLQPLRRTDGHGMAGNRAVARRDRRLRRPMPRRARAGKADRHGTVGRHAAERHRRSRRPGPRNQLGGTDLGANWVGRRPAAGSAIPGWGGGECRPGHKSAARQSRGGEPGCEAPGVGSPGNDRDQHDSALRKDVRSAGGKWCTRLDSNQ